MAEGVGFEPTVGCPTLDFESSALNRTQPPFPDRSILSDLIASMRNCRTRLPEFAKAKHRAIWRFSGGLLCGTNQRDIEALAKASEPEVPGFPLPVENF